jgi:hypothetical protein
MEDINNYLVVYEFNKKIRLGEKNDGGYVIGELDRSYDFYISAGVSNEESFSRDFINKYNISKLNAAAFDGTIDNYPYHYTKNIFFYKRNISPFKDDKNATLDYFMNKYSNIFLKMDIEGGEYPWLLYLTKDKLNTFLQITIEFHGLYDNSWGNNHKDKLECLKKLSETHYVIHTHGNNFSGTTMINGNACPDVLEITYIRKDYFVEKPQLNTTTFPIENLDYPNNPSLTDIPLNFYPFVSQ